jgi:2-amino-4-hydroxy-6-hydroxymethyldihydropteridine diphosphokinase
MVECSTATFAEALIALGGNVGDVRSTFDRAVAMLCDGAAVQLKARSSDYHTPPWGVTDQPPFINAVVAVATSLPPRDLFARALEVERALGRDRNNERRWGPRTIDVDLLAYDDLVLNDIDLVLPHPRLFERAFVLVPLAEIAPGRVIAGISVSDALARLDRSGIEKLGPRSRPTGAG